MPLIQGAVISSAKNRIWRIHESTAGFQALNRMNHHVMLFCVHWDMTLDSGKPLRTAEPVNDGDRAQRDQVGEES
jgi:hypothetical protein